MMAKIIEAKAVITAEDKTGAVFDKISKKVESLVKSAKNSKSIDGLTKSLASAQKQMAAIDRLGASRTGFLGNYQRFREAEKAVAAAARAMKEGQGDAKQLARDYEKAQAAVSRASQALERQKSAIMSNKRALEDMGIPASQAARHQDQLRAAVERTNAALNKQPGRVRRAASATARGLANVAPFAGPAILHGTKKAAISGAEIQSEIVKMRAAGIPEAEINAALGQSSGLMAKYTNVKRSDMLERYKELRSVLTHPEETPHMLEPVIKANAAMNAIDRSGELGHGLQFAIKAAEVMGLAQDPKRFEHYLDAFVKAQQVMGKTITPEQQFDLATNFKASAATLSDRFKTTTGISLAQEMRGMRAGVGVDQFIKQIVGGFQGSQHAAAKEFVALGLANKDDFEQTKTGSIKGFKPGRHVAGAKLAASDPDQWVYQYLLPALEKKGITGQDDQISMVRRLFTSSRSADIVAKLIQQRTSFENHAKLYGKAQGLDAIGNNQQDPFVALNSLGTSISNFAATLTSPVMQDAAGVMSNMASSVGKWADAFAGFQKEHPEAAKLLGGGALAAGAVGGGVATYSLFSGLMSGFGLTTSAAALDASAAALTGAAAALSGKDLAGGVAGAAAKKTMPTVPLLTALTLPLLTSGDTPDFQRDLLKKSVEESTARFRRGRDFTLGSNRNLIGNIGSDSSFQRLSQAGSLLDGSPYTTSSAFRYKEAPVVKADVSGQVSGETTVNVKIEASSELLRVVSDAKAAKAALSGRLTSNGPGSAGHSSPDSGATGASGSW